MSNTALYRKEGVEGIEAPSVRTQRNIVARQELALLNWLCRRMPSAVTPDMLTAVGFVGALIVFLGYVTSNLHPAFFWLATFGLIVQWFGDSLDGSLARYRRLERSHYGYFLDHSVDTISILLILIGLGFSPYVHLEMALFALVGYLIMCIYVFLFNHVTGNFQLSFLRLGPTELRMVLIGANIMMYSAGDLRVLINHEIFTVYDLCLCSTALTLLCLYIMDMLKVARRLRNEDDSGAA